MLRRSSLLLAAALLVPVVLLGTSGLGAHPAGAQSEAERELSRARAALEQVSQELRAAEQEASSRQASLADAEAQLERIEAVVNEVALEVERQRVLVRDAEADLQQAERELATLEEQAIDRIARLFKQGPELTFETLLSSEGAEEAIARTQLLERVVLADQVDLESLEAARVNVEVRREIVLTEQDRLEEQLAEQEHLLAQAEELRASRALAAADAERRASQLSAEHEGLEGEEDALVALIERQREEERRREAERRAAAERAAQASAPAPAAGRFAWPMCAPVTSEYGPRWGSMHRGIDLARPVGTPIRAIGPGTVIFAGWQGGYGYMTLIDHGGGIVSAYAHQRGFAVGQGARVAQGEVIGYIGMTGYTTGPHVHLEIRVGGSAVNPRQYLSGSPC
ncbi:MAG: murein hydrolase activator EnvC family protein [Nitriliruptoraceae bacterium]